MIGAVDTKAARGWIVVVDGVRCRVLGTVGADRWRLLRPDRSTFLLAAHAPAFAAADTAGVRADEPERRDVPATASEATPRSPAVEAAPRTCASDEKT